LLIVALLVLFFLSQLQISALNADCDRHMVCNWKDMFSLVK